MERDSQVELRRKNREQPRRLESQLQRSRSSAETSQHRDPYADFALAEALDRRRLVRAALVAVVAHAVLLVVQLPAAKPIVAAGFDRPVVHLLEPVRFEPRDAVPERELPRPRQRRVPMPDPTPDAPEPLPSPEEEPFRLEVDEDVIFDVPEGAPEAAQPDPRYDQVLPLGGDVQKPVKVHAPAPVYTELARRARIQGIVILQAVIDREGAVVSAEIVRGLPMGLNEAALEAVRQWRYEPATLQGRPVAVQFNLTVKFELH